MINQLRVTPIEISYLKLAARRMFNFQKEAADRGEAYHDVSAGTTLSAGAVAKLSFETTPGGLEPRLRIWNTALPQEELEKIAVQVLDGPVTRYTDVTAAGEYVFSRKTV